MESKPALGPRIARLAAVGAGLAIGAAAFAPLPAQAARWTLIPSIDGKLTATSNANFEQRGERNEDAVVEIAPRVSFRGDGAQLRLNGSVGFAAVDYIDGSQSSQVIPSADLALRLEAIERTFFIEGNVRVERTLDNPFGPQTSNVSSVNTQDTTRASISPYFTGNLGSRFRYQLRHDTTWTRASGAATDIGNQYTNRESAELTLIPRPLGASVSYARDESNAAEIGGARRRSQIARATVSISPDPQYSLGARAGYEKNNFPGFNSERNFYGFELAWRPTDRTSVSLAGEDRFFGKAWQASFAHRMPRLAFTIRSSRDVSTLSQRFLSLPATADVAALIDASLTTRIPDPIERTRAVEDLIISRGLPRSLIAPVDLFNERVEIQTSSSATVSWLGVRNTLALTLFATRTEGLRTTAALTPGDGLLDNRQRGAGLAFSHQLTPLTTLNAETSWRQTRGLGSLASEDSRQQSYLLRLSTLLSPKTTATAGARYQVFDSNAGRDATEVSVFVGIGHRF